MVVTCEGRASSSTCGTTYGTCAWTLAAVGRRYTVASAHGPPPITPIVISTRSQIPGSLGRTRATSNDAAIRVAQNVRRCLS